MNSLIRNLFTITLASFIVAGIITVFIQMFCILTGNSELSIYINDNVQNIVIAVSGICGLLSFFYLLLLPKEKQRDKD